jgi:F-type H+-transporting ATPase subunit alpha
LNRQPIETSTNPEIAVDEVGTVITLGDGIARVHGPHPTRWVAPSTRSWLAKPPLSSRTNIAGIAMNLEENQVGVP